LIGATTDEGEGPKVSSKSDTFKTGEIARAEDDTELDNGPRDSDTGLETGWKSFGTLSDAWKTLARCPGFTLEKEEEGRGNDDQLEGRRIEVRGSVSGSNSNSFRTGVESVDFNVL
jgi:hypothetical protein